MRSVNIVNNTELSARVCAPRSVIDIYIYDCVYHMFMFPFITPKNKTRHKRIAWKIYYDILSEIKVKLLVENYI